MEMNDLIKYEKGNHPVTTGFDLVAGSITIPENLLIQSSVQLDTVENATDVVVHPTRKEIRNWNWQREKKMFINETHFLPATSNTASEYFNEIQHKGLDLPIRERKELNNDWITIVLILALVLLVSVRVGFQKYISTLFQSVINYSTSFRMFQEKNYSFLHGAFRLEVLYYVIFSVFIYQLLETLHFKDTNQGLIFFGKTMGIIVLYFLLKKVAYRFLGIVFNTGAETSEFLFNLNNYNRAASIALFPVVALIAFYPFGNQQYVMLLGIITAGFFYVMLLQRGIIILMKKQFSIFYLFLYLCTLEFLPLLLIYKIVVE